MKLWGFDTSDPAGLQGAVDHAGPLLDNVFNRITRMLHSLLDRFDIDIKIKLNPYAKGQPVANQPTTDA